MRALIFSVFLVMVGCVSYDVTEVASASQKVSRVVDLAGLDKSQVYDRASVWVAKRYVSANDVVQDRNEEAGRIMGRGIATIYIQGGMMDVPDKYYYALRIDTKEGRARITFSDYRNSSYGTEPKYAYLVKPLKTKMNELALDFEAHMKSKVEVAADSDW